MGKLVIENFEHLRCAVKLEVENFEHLCLELIKNKNHQNDTGPHLFCVLHRIGSNSFSNLAVAPFCAKNMVLDGWVGGW